MKGTQKEGGEGGFRRWVVRKGGMCAYIGNCVQ